VKYTQTVMKVVLINGTSSRKIHARSIDMSSGNLDGGLDHLLRRAGLVSM
jgi:hypothetical protein